MFAKTAFPSFTVFPLIQYPPFDELHIPTLFSPLDPVMKRYLLGYCSPASFSFARTVTKSYGVRISCNTSCISDSKSKNPFLFVLIETSNDFPLPLAPFSIKEKRSLSIEYQGYTFNPHFVVQTSKSTPSSDCCSMYETSLYCLSCVLFEAIYPYLLFAHRVCDTD